MASGKTFRIGKMLINVSSRGIATKDTSTGEIRRHAFPWTEKRPVQPEPPQEEYDDEQEPYDESEYDEEAYQDDGQRYAADDPDDYDYAEEEDDQPQPAGLLGAVWFMWLMLIVLPPFGIWLLWKHNRYEITVRSAISAASVVWFIVMLIWLFSRIGGKDSTVKPDIPSASPSATVSASATVDPSDDPLLSSPTPNAGGSSEPSATPNAGSPAEPSATPNAGGSTEPTATANASTTQFVYSTTNGDYYHSYATCSNMTNASRVTLSVALSRNQTACPKCWAAPSATVRPTATPLPAGSYYATPTGQYYHANATCSGMKNAQVISQAEAIARNQTACPVCLGSVYMTDGGTYYHSNSTCSGMKNAKLVTVDDAVAAGKSACPTCMGGVPGGSTATNAPEGTATVTDNVFYCTTNGKYYHNNATCSGMSGAYRTTAAAAENNGKTACPVCLGGNSGVDSYYATTGGTYYHTNATCSGMKNASRISLATAIKRGQTACPVCAGGTTGGIVDVDPGNATGSPSTADDNATYYSTTDGTYFHTSAICSGMKGATAVTASEIAARNQTPCPKCIGTSGTYYSTPTGTYYHSSATCSGMKGADIVTLAMIRSRGQTACPKCIGGSTGSTPSAPSDESGYYYATSGGTYYHSNSTCSGMKGATKITEAAAKAAGKTPCPTCIGSVYSVSGGTYYHKDSTCSGMKNAKLTTILAAEKAGQTPCPVCIGGGSTGGSTGGGSEETDNLAYYATTDGVYYHRTATCSGMKGATKISEAAAKAAGKTPCPKCIGTVYATEGGDYYHKTSSCSGMKGAKLMTVDQAELSGKSPCPVCLGGTPIEDTGSTGGGSSVDPDTTEVWVTIEGAKYHSEQYCSGMKNAAKTTLTWALNHNYKRCTVCNAPAV